MPLPDCLHVIAWEGLPVLAVVRKGQRLNQDQGDGFFISMLGKSIDDMGKVANIHKVKTGNAEWQLHAQGLNMELSGMMTPFVEGTIFI